MMVMTAARMTSDDRRRLTMAGFRSVARGRMVPIPLGMVAAAAGCSRIGGRCYQLGYLCSPANFGP
jgi:hypothetical protein